MKQIIVSGGAGFIGSHFVDILLFKSNYIIHVVDSLTYAGKEENMASFIADQRVHFHKIDITDNYALEDLFSRYEIDIVVNFAAESHVDNSILNPGVFINTNIIGVYNLLQAAMKHWSLKEGWEQSKLFIQVSTDEVYGSLGKTGAFVETDNLVPSSPYSASKASADLLCLSYFKTFSFPVVITRSSNNYGPRQDKEKLIPKTISKLLENNKVPIYGTGENVRDWIYVKDNCNAIFNILQSGNRGEIYNIGGNNELSNILIVKRIINLMDKDESNIAFVDDRLGHDYRYAINDSKLKGLIGKYLETGFDQGIMETISFYLNN
jgi:dTDP-glucose 4,6-dehydratase